MKRSRWGFRFWAHPAGVPTGVGWTYFASLFIVNFDRGKNMKLLNHRRRQHGSLRASLACVAEGPEYRRVCLDGVRPVAQNCSRCRVGKEVP